MREQIGPCFVIAAALVLGAGIARAQEGAGIPLPPGEEVIAQAGMPGEPGPPPEGFGERIELLGFAGMHGGKVVKGAPFTATATSQTAQTLADGNHISRTITTNLFRDSQGRFRKEGTMPAIGPQAASGQSRSFVVISDPVAGVQYMLQPEQKVAHKMPAFGAGKGKGKNFAKGEGPGGKWKERAEANVQKESLGTQTIAGVNAEGTRFTRTIPAGQMGNDKAITIVSERWFSADLQTVVMSKHSDPRFGETTYTLTNIQRQEPAASLFTVPADYTVKEGGPRKGQRRFRGGPPADAPAPPSGD